MGPKNRRDSFFSKRQKIAIAEKSCDGGRILPVASWWRVWLHSSNRRILYLLAHSLHNLRHTERCSCALIYCILFLQFSASQGCHTALFKMRALQVLSRDKGEVSHVMLPSFSGTLHDNVTATLHRVALHWTSKFLYRAGAETQTLVTCTFRNICPEQRNPSNGVYP